MFGKAEKFVELVKNNPCLYNHTLPEYSRRDATERAWIEVAEEMNLSITECKEKWRNMRSNFVRTLKLTDNLKKPYYLYEKMLFLKDYIQPNNMQRKRAAHGKLALKENTCVSVGNDESNLTESDTEYQYSEKTEDSIAMNIFKEESEAMHEETSQKEGRVDGEDEVKAKLEATSKKRKREDSRNDDVDAIDTEEKTNVVELEFVETDRKSIASRRAHSRKMFLLSLMPDLEKLTDKDFMQFRINIIAELQKLIYK